MSVTTEIKNKEKSLAELMGRILKVPLTPLEDSMKALHDGILDTNELIEDINNAIGVSAGDVEEMRTLIKQQFIEIRDDDIPTMMNNLQEYISQQATLTMERVDISLGEQSTKHEEHINTISEKVLKKLTAILDGYLEVKQLIARQGDQLTSTSQKIESEHTTTVQKIDTTYKAIANDIENSSASITEKLAENLIEGEKKSAQQQNNHIELLDVLTQQQTILREQLAFNQRKLTKLTTVIGIYFFFTLAFICYDIWHQFHW